MFVPVFFCYSINVLQQTACLVVNPITFGNFAFFNCLFICILCGLTSDSLSQFRLKNVSIDEMVGPDALAVGLIVGFLLLPYSVLCTVESLTLLYLLFIS